MGSPSSLSPPEVPMELHVVNRKKLLHSFRDHLSISSRPLHGFIVLQGGEEKTRHGTDHIELFSDEIAKVLHQQYQGPGKTLLYLLHGLNTDTNNFSKPADFKGIDNFETDPNALHPILTECRVSKSALELAVIQFANDISSEAHVEFSTALWSCSSS